ncbi:putative NADP oxidoreductase coenzyme F420-dependent [Mesorhizobium plurifarium]|uniref:Putative NADP oxidoreductase coenzyme F420-dependent n=1 Tax=Mesorhizobium plurifarium TaxID=69974 RepID=A0A090DXP8_MESPL|nr:putative NADP oxidoreductase coenzyme F420-dependent [Mesorhizobium plurifarium]
MVSSVAVIGTGRMGSMLLQASHRFSPGRFQLFASGRQSTLDPLKDAIADLRTGSAGEIAAACDLIILAVQPANYLALVAKIAPALKPGAVLVSITNGIPLEAIAERSRAPLVKAVPNVAHAVGRGISLVMSGPRADTTHVGNVVDFISPFSKPVVIPARDARPATNITSCGPALLSLFATALVQANAKKTNGVGHDVLLSLMNETLGATAAMIDAGIGLEQIMRDAATGGGMTQAALEALSLGLPELADAAVEQTFARERLLNASSMKPTRQGGDE